MASQEVHIIFELLLGGTVLGLVVSILRLIIMAASFVFRKSGNKGSPNSRLSRTDLIIRNRPGNLLNNFPHENGEDNNYSQYPKYFE